MGSSEYTARGYPRPTTGFTSPAEDYFEKPLDLHDLLVHHRDTTFLLPLPEGSWGRSGALPRGSLLLVDQSLDATVGRTVLASLEGELVVGLLREAQGKLLLEGVDPPAQSLDLSATSDFRPSGVVTALLRPLLEVPVPLPENACPPGKLADLNALLVSNPPATFFAYVEGSAHARAGISPGDVLVVDRSLDAHDGRYVIAYLQGRLALRRVEQRAGRFYLHAGASEARGVEITKEALRERLWGVASWVLHSLLGPFPHVSKEAPR